MLLIEGATVAAVSYAIGILSGRRKTPRPYVEPKVIPVCGCKHHRSFHKEGGTCKHIDSWGERCQCQHYVGPEPLPQYYAPEIGG